MDVFFEAPRGRPFSIEIGFFDTVLEIKEKIQKYQGIPIANQTLIFKGQVLQDEHDVERCEILQNSCIQLLVAPESDIKVEESSSSSSSTKKIQIILRMPTSKAQVPIEVDMNDTVLQLKEKIQEMEGVLIMRLVLYSNGVELQDQKTLHDSELFYKSEVDIQIEPSHATMLSTSGGTTSLKKLKIIVLTQCGTKKIAIEVNASDNVGELRKELQKLQHHLSFHLPSEGYFFIYKQNVMDDDQSFRWHHVGNGDTIEIFNGSITGGLS